jgi:hypothetical protein
VDDDAGAALLRELGTRASAVTDICLHAHINDPTMVARGARLVTIHWRQALKYVTSCRRGAGAGAVRLRAVTVSVAVANLTNCVSDLHAALDITEREALAVTRPSGDDLRALPGTPRLFLHAHFAGGYQDERNEGPGREIFRGHANTANLQ